MKHEDMKRLETVMSSCFHVFTFPTRRSTMSARMPKILGTLAALAMVVAAMWGWNSAWLLAQASSRPDVTLWAIRSGAVALAAGAQAIFVTCLVCVVYRRDLFAEFLRFSAALIAAVALVSAVALGLAGH
jgi:hypothetical protein